MFLFLSLFYYCCLYSLSFQLSWNKKDKRCRFFPCPQRTASDTVIACSPRATAAFLLRELMRNLSNRTLDCWGRFMGSYASHLLPFSPPTQAWCPTLHLSHLLSRRHRHAPIILSLSEEKKVQRKHMEVAFDLFALSQQLFPLVETEIASLMTHVWVFWDSSCRLLKNKI